MTDTMQLNNAQVIWQEDGAPYSPGFDDVYFSREGGLAETHHVFLAGNDLLTRWQTLDAALQAENRDGVFSVAELGFGTGLNFLCTWRLWQQAACQRLRLHYISCEKHPLTHADLSRALQQWPELAPWRDALLALYPDHTPGFQRLPLRLAQPTDGTAGEVTLDLYYGDALTSLQSQVATGAAVDAWYLDGFTPTRNMDLWSETLLALIAERTRRGGTLASYSVTGRVVRALRGHGFDIEKRPGFGSKREMLVASRPSSASDSLPGSLTPPAASASTTLQRLPVRHAVVIGAGLAGATVARALATRGVEVTVLEQRATSAEGASGNRQAVVQLRLNRTADALWQFNVHSYLFALRYYARLAAESDNTIHWHPCGVMTLPGAYTHTRRRPEPGDYDHYASALLTTLSVADVEQRTGLRLQTDADVTLQPGGGWLNPQVCTRYCLSHPRINVVTGQHVAHIQKSVNNDLSSQNNEPVWQTLDAQGNVLAQADALFICTSYAARQLPQAADLPVYPLRGQISHLTATAASAELRTVICGERYLAPAHGGQHCVGASYIKCPPASPATPADYLMEQQLDETEHEQNLAGLGTIAAQLGLDANSTPQGRASVRGSSGDFMPMGGMLAEAGLYISVGHGSHGTTTCPLIAEHLAALACGEISPLSADAAGCIDPQRFAERRRRREQRSRRPTDK